MRIALLKNDGLCYGSLKYFLEAINRVLTAKGIQTEMIATIDDAFMEANWDAVIGINQEVFAAQLENGVFVFDCLNCPIFLLILDAPYHHNRILLRHPQNLHLICLDEEHVQYSKKYYGPLKSVEMGYVLGNVIPPIPYEQRKIDVLFSGTRSNIERIDEVMHSYQEKWVPQLFEYLVRKGKEDPNSYTEKWVYAFWEEKGVSIPQDGLKQVMAVCGASAEFYLRGYYREKILRELAENQIPLTILGDGWEEFAKDYRGNVTLEKSVAFSETARYFTNAKIVLNVMPWFKNGCHDRVPTSMYNGAVCITDKSGYIERQFTDGKNIVLYDLERIEELPEKIRMLLSDSVMAQQIAQNGYEKVQKEYTWENMVEQRILAHIS